MRVGWLLLLLLASPIVAAGGFAAEPRADLIVTLVPGASAPPDVTLLSVLPAFVLHDATAADAARWAADARVVRVDWAKPLERHSAPALPSSAFTGLTRAQDSGFTGAGITVAVLDSGIDASHPDLVGRVKTNVRLANGQFAPGAGDTDGHGTHVAGLLAASGAASSGRWHGVAPGASLVGVDISERFTTSSAVLAFDWLYAHRAEHGIRVVVNAWGRVPDGDAFDQGDPVIRAIDRLVASGVVVLFSASNHGPAADTLSIEAMDPYVITVGATDAAGLLASYSSRGPVASAVPWTKPDVVAPGDAAVGPRSLQTSPRAEDPDPLYTIYSGTSQAVPHVGGIVALMLEAQPDLTPADVGAALRASAIDLAPAGPDDATGYGLVDARDALRIATGAVPDHGNVLIAGGIDRAEDSADVAATARRGLLDFAARPGIVWETPFVVKIGTQRLHVEASGAGVAPFTIELAKGARVVRGGDIENPAPGIWLMRLRGVLPTATRIDARFESTLPANPERALETDGRFAPPYAASVEPPLFGGVPAQTWLPLTLWAASGMVLAFAIMPRKRAP